MTPSTTLGDLHQGSEEQTPVLVGYGSILGTFEHPVMKALREPTQHGSGALHDDVKAFPSLLRRSVHLGGGILFRGALPCETGHGLFPKGRAFLQ
jgi:hypothetical protein